jgi:hypothetical protein
MCTAGEQTVAPPALTQSSLFRQVNVVFAITVNVLAQQSSPAGQSVAPRQDPEMPAHVLAEGMHVAGFVA